MKKLLLICMLGLMVPGLTSAQSDAKRLTASADRTDKPIEKYSPEELSEKWMKDLNEMVRLQPEQIERFRTDEILHIARKEIEVKRRNDPEKEKFLTEINEAKTDFYKRILNEGQFAKYEAAIKKEGLKHSDNK